MGVPNMPNFTPLIYFGLFGIACAAILALAGASWLAYHLFMALAAYFGA